MPLLKKWGVLEVVIAYDADQWALEKRLETNLCNFATAVKESGMRAMLAHWPVEQKTVVNGKPVLEPKGLDDLLAKGLMPELFDTSDKTMNTIDLRAARRALNYTKSGIREKWARFLHDMSNSSIYAAFMEIRWVAVLFTMLQAPGPMSWQEIKDVTRLPRSTVTNSIKTLMDMKAIYLSPNGYSFLPPII
jgi:hypothetical protein